MPGCSQSILSPTLSPTAGSPSGATLTAVRKLVFRVSFVLVFVAPIVVMFALAGTTDSGVVTVTGTIATMFACLTVLIVSSVWPRLHTWSRGLRMRDPVPGTARVVSMSGPAAGAVEAGYTMTAVVSADGVPAAATQRTGVAPTRKWPQPGDQLPITIDRADPSRWRVEWDRVPDGRQTSMEAAERLAATMRVDDPDR